MSMFSLAVLLLVFILFSEIMKVFIVFCIFTACSYASPFDDWVSFKQTHGKRYSSPSEEQHRMNIFFKNKAIIDEHNKNYENGQATFHMKMNYFGDLTAEEFKSLMSTFSSSELENDVGGSTFLAPANVKIPESIDWRQKGAVTPVKKQGGCGSCWAFSATGSLEGQMFKKTGKLVSLSEQNLIDCSTDHGCTSGRADKAFNYIKDNGGIDTEESYPYEGKEGKCRFNKTTVGGTVSSYVKIPKGDEEALKKAVATVGPVSVSIHALGSSFQFYNGGVYYDDNCPVPKNRSHAVVVVGYERKDSHDYWIVKNSWGTGWGDKGYFYLARNKKSHCGVADKAIYPIV